MRTIPKKNINFILDRIIKINDDIDDTIKCLIEFYLVHDRHRYSEVAKYINEKSINDEQVIAFTLMNLEMIIEYCDENEKDIIEPLINNSKENTKYQENKLDCILFKEKLHKLKDHIELELDRIEISANRENDMRTRMVQDLNLSLMHAQQDMEHKANRIEDKLSNTVISVLGIFSAIIIAFFGGLNVLANVLTYLPNSEITIYRLIFMSCITGLIVFNTIFMLLYFISRMLDKDMGGFCGFNIIDKYEGSTGLIPRIYYRFKIIMKRHPMMFWFNTLLVFIMSGTVLIWIISKLVNLIRLV